MRSVVVLPAPSGPIRPNISPRRTSKLTSEAARTLPKRRERPRALTRVSASVMGAGWVVTADRRPAAGARWPASGLKRESPFSSATLMR